MHDLDFAAEVLYDIGEKVGGDDGYRLTDLAIIIWDIRAELCAVKGGAETRIPTMTSRR